MSVQTEEVQKILKDSTGKKSFRQMKLPGVNFDGHDLRNADFRGASLSFASFRGTNLKYANFEGANLCGADFTDANLHRANLKDCTLSGCKMFPKDAFGITLTLECRSFQGMEIADGWWWGWLMYALLMQPPTKDAEERLIQAMGPERYMVLRQQYAHRNM